MSEYKPGVCNIDDRESRKRYTTGLVGLFVSGFFSIMFLSSYETLFTLAAVFAGSVFGSMGVLQGRKNFCVAHAKKGTKKTGENIEEVETDEDYEKDSSTANEILGKSLLFGVFTVAGVYLASFLI